MLINIYFQINKSVSVENVSPADVIESCLGFLFNIASNKNNHGLFCDPGLIQMLAKVINTGRHPSEKIQKLSVSTLNALSFDGACCSAILKSGDVVPSVQTLRESKNEEIGITLTKF